MYQCGKGPCIVYHDNRCCKSCTWERRCFANKEEITCSKAEGECEYRATEEAVA
jgi:hypothetical protein